MARNRGAVRSVGWTLVLIVAFVAAAFPWLQDRWDQWSTTLQDEAAQVSPFSGVAAPDGKSESILIIVEDQQGAVASMVLGSLSESGTPVFAIIPNSIFTLLPGYGEFKLLETTLFEDEQLARVTVENMLGARIDRVLALGPGDISAALGSDIDVELSTELAVRDESGAVRVVFDSGRQTLAGDQVETLIFVRGEGDLLDWTERQSSAWTAILTAIQQRPNIADLLAPASPSADLLKAIAKSPRVVLVPAQPVSPGSEGEGFVLSGSAAEDFVVSRIPSLKLFDGSRPRVELLNGNGGIQSTRSIAEALIRAGFRIVRTDNAANFDFESTLVVAQGRGAKQVAEAAARVISVEEVLIELDTPSGVIDVSIIVGKDINSGEV